MGKKKHLTGLRVGKLLVIGRSTRWNGSAGWLCKCDCGNTACIETYYLTAGLTKSCGCSRSGKNNEALRESHIKHGCARTRLNTVYKNMKSRCINPNDRSYESYGGRGITVCDEWLGDSGFESFRDWALSSGYSDDLTIDRIDNNSGYSPQNCRWVDMSVQCRNRRSNHWVTHNGETKCLTDWAIQQGISPRIVTTRLYRGWTEEEALGFVERRKRGTDK